MRKGDPSLAFHDVDDILALARKALHDEMRARNATLSPENVEDAVSFLVERGLMLAKRYDPEKGTLAFSTLCYRTMRYRYTDYIRKLCGDNRHGHRDKGNPNIVRPNGNGQRTESVAEPSDYILDEGESREPTMVAYLDELTTHAISTASRALLRVVGIGTEAGLNPAALAEQMGVSTQDFSTRMDTLRMELRGSDALGRAVTYA